MIIKLPLTLNCVKIKYFSAKSNNFKGELKNNLQLKNLLNENFSVNILFTFLDTLLCSNRTVHANI
jgi:hypothetical protein